MSFAYFGPTNRLFSGAVQRDATIHQSIVAKGATGLELDKSWAKKELSPLVATPSQTRLAVWSGLTELKINRKALGPNEKQLAAEGQLRAVVVPNRGDRIRTCDVLVPNQVL